MDENINLRAISELPEVEAISDGYKALLVDANGMAAQIPANKLGGSGGGTIYLEGIDYSVNENGAIEDLACKCYVDEALTSALDYETGKKMLMGGAGAYLKSDLLIGAGYPSNEMGCNFSTMIYAENQRIIGGSAIDPMSRGILLVQLFFSDSVVE